MKVLMLGWEFPPCISGGLGAACAGLTGGLSQLGVDVLFILPTSANPQTGPVRFLGSAAPGPTGPSPSGPGSPNTESTLSESAGGPAESVDYLSAGCALFPYLRPEQRMVGPALVTAYPSLLGLYEPIEASFLKADQPDPVEEARPNGDGGAQDAADTLFDQVNRYADRVLALAENETFDLIHVHDWMTFPAGVALARRTGKPLVVHVHSTEFDRTGGRIHSGIYAIERSGICAADQIIAVSHLTRDRLLRQYGIDPGRVHVVYNAVDTGKTVPLGVDEANAPAARPNGKKEDRQKTVLFLGRITVQKGPEYFLAAAQKVLAVMEDVRFVMAGSGDKVVEAIHLARNLGIQDKVLFTGFLRGAEVDRAFASADVFVMPSVSEPFGIAALEAVAHHVPVIISKQSGVSEVLNHVLKADYWNTEELANKIVAVLRYPPLRNALRDGSDLDIRKMSWVAQAQDCLDVYHQAIGPALRCA